VPLIFSADETADVGRDTGSAVSDDYESESSIFTERSTGCRSILARTLRTPTT
jgi:hypothetical protein